MEYNQSMRQPRLYDSMDQYRKQTYEDWPPNKYKTFEDEQLYKKSKESFMEPIPSASSSQSKRELPQQTDSEEKSGCKYFVRGLCRRGDKCPFMHTKPDRSKELETKHWLKTCRRFRMNMCKDNECSLMHISREDEHLYRTRGIISGNALGQAIRKALLLDVPLSERKPACKEELDGNCKIMNCPFRHLTQEQFSQEVLKALKTEFEVLFGPCLEAPGSSEAQNEVIHKLITPVQEVPVTLPILQEFATAPPIVPQMNVWPPAQLFGLMQPTQFQSATSSVTNIDKILTDKLKLANQQIEKENKKYLEYIRALDQENCKMFKVLDPLQDVVDLHDMRNKLLETFELVNWKSNVKLMENTQDYQHKKSTEVVPEYPNVEPKYPSVEPKYPSVAPIYPSVEPRYPSVEPRYPSVEPKYPMVEPKYPMVDPKYPMVDPKYPIVDPKYPIVDPKYPMVEPKYPIVEPKYPSVEHKYPNVESEYSNVQESVQSSGYASVTLQKEENSEDDAILDEDNYESDPMEVEYPEDDDQSCKLFIGCLNYKTSEESLKAYFEQYGDIEECFIKRDRKKLKSKGYGFVVFSDPSVVKTVLKISQHILDGRELSVKRADVRVQKKELHAKISTGIIISDDENEKPDAVDVENKELDEDDDENKELDEVFDIENKELDDDDENKELDEVNRENEKNNEVPDFVIPTAYPIPVSGDAPWNKTFKKKDVQVHQPQLDWAFARHIRQVNEKAAAEVQNKNPTNVDNNEYRYGPPDHASPCYPEYNSTVATTTSHPWSTTPYSHTTEETMGQFPVPSEYPHHVTDGASWSQETVEEQNVQETVEEQNVQMKPLKEDGVFEAYLKKVNPRMPVGVSFNPSFQNQSTKGSGGDPDNFKEDPCKIFVGANKSILDKTAVCIHFQKYGEIVKIKCRKKYGFITFAEPSIVHEVLRNVPHTVNGIELDVRQAGNRFYGQNMQVNGSELDVQQAANRRGPSLKTVDQDTYKDDSYRIFVAGINSTIDKASVEEYFKNYGTISHIKCRKKYGFITFAESSAVNDVLQNMPHMVDGHVLYVRQADNRPKGSGKVADKDDPQTSYNRVYVGGLDTTTTENDLQAYFSPYGEIQSTDIKKNKKCVSRGFGFITFTDPAAAADVVSNSPFLIGECSVEVKPPAETEKKPSNKYLQIQETTTETKPAFDGGDEDTKKVGPGRNVRKMAQSVPLEEDEEYLLYAKELGLLEELDDDV